jgi:uncharacterized protein YndB with AHSA1/START domain
MDQTEEKAMPNTIRLHRVFSAKPEKIYRAFVEPDAVASWLPPYGFVCIVHALEAKVGGKHRMSFRNFTTAKATPSVAAMSNSCRVNALSTPTRSMTRIYRVKCEPL